MTIHVTALYAGLLGLMLIALGLRVAQRRLRLRIGLGTGENVEIERAVRVHGNFVEYVPFALILMAFYEAGGGPPAALHAAGIVLIIARIAHAAGLTGSSGRSPGRFGGTVATWLLIVALSVANVVQAVS